MSRILLLALFASAQLPLAGCTTEGEPPAREPVEKREAAPTADADKRPFVAVVHGTELSKNVRGTVHFEQTAQGMHVKADIQGLSPNSKHGFHVHEFGDCSAPDAQSAGGHYAPRGEKHALPDKSPRHAGDMGNLVADESGRATLDKVFVDMEMVGDNLSFLGRAVVVHAEADKGTGESGDAGARIACGVVGVANGADAS